MARASSEPPWRFLLSASVTSLQSYELSRLNHTANMRGEIRELLDEWVHESACAMLAQWLIQQRERRSAKTCELCGAPRQPHEAGAASDNTLGEEVSAGVIPRANL